MLVKQQKFLHRFPLHVHFWQHMLRYHLGLVALDKSRLVKLALVVTVNVDLVCYSSNK